jgi:predicted AlkP superfamily pyrophosphatase or phosphodiesterase
VIVISVDGLRPDAIAHFQARTLTRLIAEGSASLAATTILPSKTLPSHTSMLTGTAPEVHGVYWNEEEMDEHGYVATPTIFATASEAGLTTAAFFSKSKFEHLAMPGTLDHARFPRGLGKDLASKTVDAVQAYLMRARPNLTFIHLADADYAGHVFGWMSWPYGRAVQAVDREIAEVLRSADRAFGAGRYTVIVTADHGGHDRDHGTDDPRDVLIPWIAWGRGVAAGETLPDGIRTFDTAATALALLGLSAPPATAGTPVAAAFPELPAAAVAAAGGGG